MTAATHRLPPRMTKALVTMPGWGAGLVIRVPFGAELVHQQGCWPRRALLYPGP